MKADLSRADGIPLDLRARTKEFALRVIRMYTKLPRGRVPAELGAQVLRSGTSPGAQYREACRARTVAEFVSKMNSALQELDETAYWLELLMESGTVSEKRLRPLHQETEELIKIFVTCILNAKRTN